MMHQSPVDQGSSTKDARKSSIRKSKTLDRNDFAGLSEEYTDQKSKSSSLPWSGKKKEGKDVKSKGQKSPPTPPSAKLKPHGRPGTKHLSKRMLHSQSMIILDDSPSLYSSREDEQKLTEVDIVNSVEVFLSHLISLATLEFSLDQAWLSSNCMACSRFDFFC